MSIFLETLVWVQRIDMYKTVWACPYCGELHLTLVEPAVCHYCEFVTPGLSSEEYEGLEKTTKLIAFKRITAKLKKEVKQNGKGGN